MANKKVVRKVKKKNPNLRLVKNNDSKPEKSKRGQEEKLRFGRGKRILILSAILIVLLFLLIGGYEYIIHNYTITTVYVEGNVHYTNEEIMEMVMGGRYGNNSLFLSMKYSIPCSKLSCNNKCILHYPDRHGTVIIALAF